MLRKAQILATRLDHQPLKDWIRWEVDGYPDDAELPEYQRLGRVQVLGDFGGPFGSGYKNAPIAEASFASDEDKWVVENWFRHDFHGGSPLSNRCSKGSPNRFVSRGRLMSSPCTRIRCTST